MGDRKPAPIGINDVGKPFTDGKSVWRLTEVTAGPILHFDNLEVDTVEPKAGPPSDFTTFTRLIPEKRKYERKQPAEATQ